MNGCTFYVREDWLVIFKTRGSLQWYLKWFSFHWAVLQSEHFRCFFFFECFDFPPAYMSSSAKPTDHYRSPPEASQVALPFTGAWHHTFPRPLQRSSGPTGVTLITAWGMSNLVPFLQQEWERKTLISTVKFLWDVKRELSGTRMHWGRLCVRVEGGSPK